MICRDIPQGNLLSKGYLVRGQNGFDHDRSAARGEMATRRLIIFKHPSELGNRQAQDLFDSITCKRSKENEDKPARSFTDYEVCFNGQPLEKIKTVVDV